MDLIFDSNGEYGRHSHDYQAVLETAIGKLYGQTAVQVAPSGMSAISCVLHSFLNEFPNGEIWYCDELYYETTLLIESLKCEKHKCRDLDEIDAEGKNILIFFESCSNPHGRIPNYKCIEQIREKNDYVVFVIDNTWLTSVIFNPFDEKHAEDFDVDIVVVSLTKYYSGGSAIGGAIISDSCGLFINITDFYILNGIHISPYDCKVILDNMSTMRKRIQNASLMTYMLIDKLEKMGVKVYHPLVDNKEFVDKYCYSTDVPSVLYFKTEYKNRKDLLKSTPIHEKTSYGGKDNRIELNYEGNDIYVRLSVGYNDLIICEDDLERLIHKS
jgi:cystathionine beta-lyase/cystathionine gamma-synthase